MSFAGESVFCLRYTSNKFIASVAMNFKALVFTAGEDIRLPSRLVPEHDAGWICGPSHCPITFMKICDFSWILMESH